MADGKSSKRFELTSEKRPAPFLIADARALDFLNSVATPVDTPLEWIESGQDLLSWLGAAGLISPSVRAGFQKSAVPGELDAVAAQARALREWFRSFVQKHRGQPLRQDAVKEIEPLNRVLARDEAFGQIRDRSWPSAGAVAIHVANREALALSRHPAAPNCDRNG